MVRRGGRGYQTQAQKEGRSAGQRKRRMARDRKRRNRELNLYRISVRTATLEKADTDDLALYGIVRTDDGDWQLTALTARRDEERMVSDRQGAVRSEVVDRLVMIPPTDRQYRPENGLPLDTFDTKQAAMDEVGADTTTRLDTGVYVVRPTQTWRDMATFKVDRDDFRDFKTQRTVYSVK